MPAARTDSGSRHNEPTTMRAARNARPRAVTERGRDVPALRTTSPHTAMPIHDTPRLQTATDTPADAHALRASLTALVQGGHGDDRLDLRPDGSFATTPASRPATGLVGRFKAAFRGLRDVFRRTPRTTEPPRASASFSTLHVLYEMARGRHGAGVADLAFVPTSLAQRSVAVGDPRDISVARAVQLLDSADQQAA